jgi:hypothetical protein
MTRNRGLGLLLICGLAATASCGESEDTCKPLACRSSLVIKYSKDVTGLYKATIKAGDTTYMSDCPKSLAPLVDGVSCDEKKVTVVGLTDVSGPVMVSLTTVTGTSIAAASVTTTAGAGSMMNACSSCSIREGTLP